MQLLVLGRLTLLVIVFVALCLSSVSSRAMNVDFQRDIRPIFTEHCASCHGADEEARQSDLRLDVREQALVGGSSGEPAVVPGQPLRSELISRITSQEDDTVMPPTSEKKPLSKRQIELLEQWIEQGAEYSAHWAFTLPRKRDLSESGPDHPIDNLVTTKLHEMQMQLSPAAAKSTLCRRLYLDLIGLPPSPDQVRTFNFDEIETTIGALLSSERFGEKWARHWLDVARYSDTNGYEKDLRRDQWAWRDWVVEALNADMSYDQFIVEQMAGDLLPNPTQQQVVATGFLRNSMLNEEGAIVPEQFRMVEMFDRMDCLGKAVLGLTTQCAQCHTHKFDPLTQTEYYGMFAFLNNTYEAKSAVYTTEEISAIGELQDSISTLEERVRQQHPQWQTEIEKWSRDVARQLSIWTPMVAAELGSISGLNHPVQLRDKSLLMLGHTSNDIFMIAAPAAMNVTGLRLELLNHGDLPHLGPGRGKTGTWSIRELEVFVAKPNSDDWKKISLANATADFSEPETTTDDGEKKSGPVEFLIDGSDDTFWEADRGIGRRNQPSVSVVQFSKPVDLSATRLKLALRMNDNVGCCRISITSDDSPTAPPVDHAAVMALTRPADLRSKEENQAIFTVWRKTQSDCEQLNREIAQLWDRYPQGLTTVLHLAEREMSNRRTTHRLDRGQWDRSQEAVQPHTPAMLHPMAVGDRNRLSFARWLVSKRSPLTARVAVNRVWQAIFGQGLVETPEDFGTRAAVPEYLELLDWLAVDFMEHGWSQKHLIKSIVTSATYQQTSRASPRLITRDPRNRLLARGPRFRCDAEVVRDIALSASGLIKHQLGGPPVIPPVPKNVLDYNFVYPLYWIATEGPNRYRRTLYGFRKRSMPDPVMSSFDGPNGDFSCAKRARSNTPLAALTGLNETVFYESAQAMALRILRETGSTDTERAAYAFQLCTARRPNAVEEQEIQLLLETVRKRLADGWLNPREVTTGDAKKLPELPDGATPQDGAAWTIVSRVLLNLDETICKN